MRFLYFTDTHIRGTNPRNRKDNFFEALQNKFREIKVLSDQLEVDYILHGGDWFDRPDISPSVVREFAFLIRDFGRPIYTVAGNHDVFGQNPETIGRTMLGILESIQLFTLLGTGEKVILEKNGVRVQLTGQPYHFDMDGANFRNSYLVEKQPDVEYAVHLVHGMLLTKPFFEGIQYTLVEDMLETQADITLAGHYHSGFETVEVPGAGGRPVKYIINPGSLVRVTSTLSEMERKPKVVFIELNGGIHIREIELKSAQPGEDVLDRLQMEKSQNRNQKLQMFYQGIHASGEYKKMDMAEIINEIAANDALSEEVKAETVRRIALASEALSREGDGG